MPPHYVEFDFSNIEFVDGIGLVVLMNLTHWLKSQGVEIRYKLPEKRTSYAIRYLDDSGFFEKTFGDKLFEQSSPRPTTLPCSLISDVDVPIFVEGRLSAWLSRYLSVEIWELATLRTVIKELCNNVRDHSGQSSGFIHAQYYPKNETIQLTVADFGIGIPANIKKTFGEMRDDAALIKAAEYGVTTQSQPRNRGFGLANVIDGVTQAQGRLIVYSGQAWLIARPGSGQPWVYEGGMVASFPGTLVDIVLTKAKFVGDEIDEEDFEW